MNDSTIDVIVPVRNEAASLPEFWDRIRRVPLALHPIFVDNASMDGTVAFIETLEGVTLTRHARNEGYGGSILDGIRAATARRLEMAPEPTLAPRPSPRGCCPSTAGPAWSI